MVRQKSEVLYMSHGASAQSTFEYNKKAIAREPQIKYSLVVLQVMKPYICVGLKMILCIGV